MPRSARYFKHTPPRPPPPRDHRRRPWPDRGPPPHGQPRGCLAHHRPPPSRRAAVPRTRAIMVEAEVERDGNTSIARRYYLSSMPARRHQLRPRRASSLGYREPTALGPRRGLPRRPCRLRTGDGPENMATVKHMALNLVRQPATSTASRSAARRRPGTPPISKPSSAKPLTAFMRLPWQYAISLDLLRPMVEDLRVSRGFSPRHPT